MLLKNPDYLDRAIDFLEHFYAERQELFRKRGIFNGSEPLFNHVYSSLMVSLLLDCGGRDTVGILCGRKKLGYFIGEQDRAPFFPPYRLIPGNDLVVFLAEHSRGTEPLWENVEVLLRQGMVRPHRILSAMGSEVSSRHFDYLIDEEEFPSFNISSGEKPSYVLPILTTRDYFVGLRKEHFPKRKIDRVKSGLKLHAAYS